MWHRPIFAQAAAALLRRRAAPSGAPVQPFRLPDAAPRVHDFSSLQGRTRHVFGRTLTTLIIAEDVQGQCGIASRINVPPLEPREYVTAHMERDGIPMECTEIILERGIPSLVR